MMVVTEGRLRAAPIAMVLAVTALAVTSCFSDLPPAAVCPAVAASPASDCTQDLAKVETAAQPCTQKPEASTITCLSLDSCEACAPEAQGCFPAPSCPPDITRPASGALQCARIVSDEGAPRTCRPCARDHCASVCDGRGPVFAYSTAAIGDNPNFLLAAGDATPPMGVKVGVYARMRGRGRVRLVIRSGGASTPLDVPVLIDSSDFASFSMMTTTLSKGGQLNFGISPGTPQPVPDKGAIVEIDCIVPYWVLP
jgi:hypothetical protein